MTADPQNIEAPEGFVAYPSSNPFIQPLGQMYEKVDPDGTAIRGFWLDDKHMNSAGIVHGGMLMTFADIIAARPLLDLDVMPFVTIQLNTKFLATARCGEWIEGRSHLNGRDDDLFFLSGYLNVGERKVAAFDAIFKKI